MEERKGGEEGGAGGKMLEDFVFYFNVADDEKMMEG